MDQQSIFIQLNGESIYVWWWWVLDHADDNFFIFHCLTNQWDIFAGDIIAKNGVVIATEKKLPTILVDEDSHHKISVVNASTG